MSTDSRDHATHVRRALTRLGFKIDPQPLRYPKGVVWYAAILDAGGIVLDFIVRLDDPPNGDPQISGIGTGENWTLSAAIDAFSAPAVDQPLRRLEPAQPTLF